jgi:hypothetical protein
LKVIVDGITTTTAAAATSYCLSNLTLGHCCSSQGSRCFAKL